MNELLKGLKKQSNYTFTENGAKTHISTLHNCLDLFAIGGAIKNSPDINKEYMIDDCLAEDKLLAMKLLFYLRDVRGGLGEGKTFKVMLKHIANTKPYLVKKNIELIPHYGRWDDILVLMDTKCKKEAVELIRNTLIKDLNSKSPTLLAKWLPSENASSSETRVMARRLAKELKLSKRNYRKILSVLRKRIKIVETFLTEKDYDKIEFSKLPSRAGLMYKNTFMRHEELKDRYLEFINNKNSKVHADVLYPYEIIEKVRYARTDDEKKVCEKYWDNQIDYFEGKKYNILPVIDTSASMTWGVGKVAPIDIAISLGLYCAERNKGDFYNHYISFSREAKLIEIKGDTLADKVRRIYRANLCQNTNIESVFDLVLETIEENNLDEDCLPNSIVIISDMEFDRGTCVKNSSKTLMENIRAKWLAHGYKMPNLVYWNVNARQKNMPEVGKDGISYVSGCSPSIFKSVLTGKTGYELMLEVLNSERYSLIKV